jgi:hypothetical protein
MFAINIFNNASQTYKGLCEVDANSLTPDQLTEMVRILKEKVIDVMRANDRVAVHDVLYEISGIVGHVEMDLNLQTYGTRDFGTGDCTLVFMRHVLPNFLWDEFRYDGRTDGELHQFLFS